MKKTLIISIFIFWLAMSTFFTVGLFFKKNVGSTPGLSGQNNSGIGNGLGQSSGTGAGTGTGQALTITAAVVAQHNSPSDCWMIISDKVYNLTSYLSAHPGGSGTILPYCGKDGTVAFQTKDIGQPHSSYAQSLLENYFVADLNQTINTGGQNDSSSNRTVSPAPIPAPKPKSTPAPSSMPSSVSSGIALTSAEVAKHNNAGDCWMIISNKVYRLTSYIPAHPGGSAMVPYCGRDGTAAFTGLPHSANAASLLANYLLGNLNAQTVITPPNPSAPAALPPVNGGEAENEFEDD